MWRVVVLTIVYAVTPVPFTLGPFAPWSIYVRWPQNPPFLIPPATPKLPFAPEGVPVIHPPPVTKSLSLLQAGAPWHTISAGAEEATTSATPSTGTGRALTVRSALLASW